MKIVYQEKNIIKAQGSEWKYCDGCIFNMEAKIIEGKTFTIRFCYLFNQNCEDYDIYQQSTKLDEIFRI